MNYSGKGADEMLGRLGLVSMWSTEPFCDGTGMPVKEGTKGADAVTGFPGTAVVDSEVLNHEENEVVRDERYGKLTICRNN